MPDLEPTSVVTRDRRQATRNSLLRRTRLRETAICLALLAGLMWVSQSSFAQVPTPNYQFQFTGDFSDTF